jgi:hypothetical protein
VGFESIRAWVGHETRARAGRRRYLGRSFGEDGVKMAAGRHGALDTMANHLARWSRKHVKMGSVLARRAVGS